MGCGSLVLCEVFFLSATTKCGLVQPWCLAVGVSRADSRGDTSRVASSVDVSEGHHRGQVAEGVVGTGSSGDTSRVDSCGPLLPAGGRQLLLLPDQLVGPPLTCSLRSRDKSGNVSRGDWDSSLPLANVVGQLTLVGNLGSPPLGGSRRARDEPRDVARGDGKGRLTSAERYQRQRRNLAEHVKTR